jgi:hypothetical protein
VNALFTSFVPAPRRIERSRVARVLVFVLAITLVCANGFAAAMPAGATMPASSSHGHCADSSTAMPHAKHGHHADDCACGGTACACMQACALLALAVPAPIAKLAVRASALRLLRIAASGAAPPLRPPIA